jgi:hypothetical protein
MDENIKFNMADNFWGIKLCQRSLVIVCLPV